VWGRQDPIIPVAHAIRAAQVIPNAELCVFEQCGHMPLWEYPDQFVEKVLGFLGTMAEKPQGL
jgi:pimeloyl-ACP methyl ester carboxylesterase